MISEEVFLNIQLMLDSLESLGVYCKPLLLSKGEKDVLVDTCGKVVKQEALLNILDAFNICIKDGCRVSRLYIDGIANFGYELAKSISEYSISYENGYADIRLENKSKVPKLRVAGESVGSYSFCYPKLAEAVKSLKNILDKEFAQVDFGERCCYTLEPFGVGSKLKGISVSKRSLYDNTVQSIHSWENKKVDDCVAFLLYVMVPPSECGYVQNIVILDREPEFYQPIYHEDNRCTMVFYGRK